MGGFLRDFDMQFLLRFVGHHGSWFSASAIIQESLVAIKVKLGNQKTSSKLSRMGFGLIDIELWL